MTNEELGKLLSQLNHNSDRINILALIIEACCANPKLCNSPEFEAWVEIHGEGILTTADIDKALIRVAHRRNNAHQEMHQEE